MWLHAKEFIPYECKAILAIKYYFTSVEVYMPRVVRMSLNLFFVIYPFGAIILNIYFILFA